jgi:hypothetical protein
VSWLQGRTRSGTLGWLEALEAVLSRLEENPLTHSLADEEELAQFDVRQIPFKTRHGKMYRALFKVVGNEVRILHVRRPGQRPLSAEDVAG